MVEDVRVVEGSKSLARVESSEREIWPRIRSFELVYLLEDKEADVVPLPDLMQLDNVWVVL